MTTIQNLLEGLSSAFKDQLPFVAYKKPNEKFVKAIFQKDSTLHLVKDYSETGFVFAPFDMEKSAVLIPLDKEMKADFTDLKVALNTDRLFEESGIDKKNHLQFTEDTLHFIDAEKISKIVIARAKAVHLSKVDFIRIFKRLLFAYPEANTYVWYHPKVGMWMGASPETLLCIDGKKIQTMSLAATQAYVNTVDVKWGIKEIEEQQMVTNYISKHLKNAVENIAVSKVYTIRSGTLLHLRTDITGVINSKKSLSEIINTLHPTPAVCGFPREKAKQFIIEKESFDRLFYAGFLGELNIDQSTNLFVNLRCLQKVSEHTLILYVGGGITAKSNAEKEWEETCFKCKIIEKVL